MRDRGREEAVAGGQKCRIACVVELFWFSVVFTGIHAAGENPEAVASAVDTGSGASQVVNKHMNMVLARMWDHVEDQLGTKLSPHKSLLVSGRPSWTCQEGS